MCSLIQPVLLCAPHVLHARLHLLPTCKVKTVSLFFSILLPSGHSLNGLKINEADKVEYVIEEGERGKTATNIQLV